MPVFRAFAAVVALIFGLLGFAATGMAQSGTVVFSGAVVSEDGEPIGGATVTASGAAERAVVTDRNGAYRFGPLPAGSYELEAKAIGYTARTVESRGVEGVLEVDFELTAAPIALAPLQVLAATRTGVAAAALPIKVEVIAAPQVRLQTSLVANPTEMLSNLIPSFSPSRQKLTSAGESFRGRRPLFLIDGVPQSNPLRDGHRDAFTIDPELIERIEVVFGANALQGLGATGGIINYVTVSAPESGELVQRASVAMTGSDSFDGDGMGWRGSYIIGKRAGDFDALASVSYERQGLQYDGEGRPIAIDNVQGDVADSSSRDLFAKLGWEPNAQQRLQLTVNDFRLEQGGNFAIVEGDRSLGIPAVSVEGDPEGTEPINDVTTVSLDYEHTAVAGGTLSAKGYYQDFSALYGGGTFDTFQDPRIAPVGELFDQSENNSEKVGARLTFSRPRVARTPVDVVTGFDFIRDKTYQRLAVTDRNWVPVTKFFNYAPFLQADVQALDWLSLSGGVRWEIAELDVPDFTTLAGNRDDLQTVEVTGGSPGFDAPLLNVGGVIRPIEGVRFYGTFSQAFTMPDVGRVLRGVSAEGTAVEDFLDLEPIKTDNVEVGGAFGTARGQIGLTYFQSEADLGSRLVPNSDGIFQVRRQPTQTKGWEFTSRFDALQWLSLGAGYSLLDGSFDGDGDGVREADLSASDIGPDRLNLSANFDPAGRFSGRIQSFTFFDETFEDGAGETTATFDGYTTIDASLAAAVDNSTFIVSVSNILDEQYITYFAQAASVREDQYFSGRGRTLTLRIETRF